MADKTFTEDEHLAILSDRVANETAELTAKVAELTAENATLKTENDKLEAAKVTAEQAAEKAAQDLTEYKAEVERAAEIAKVRDERATAVKEILGEAFVTEERAERYAAMPEAEFASFVEDLKAAAPKPGERPPAGSREAAALGGAPAKPSTETGGQPSNARALLAMSL